MPANTGVGNDGNRGRGTVIGAPLKVPLLIRRVCYSNASKTGGNVRRKPAAISTIDKVKVLARLASLPFHME